MARYTDADLVSAVARAKSWRGVLRELGLPAQSSGALRAARARAVTLGIETGHFTGQRRWSDSQLAEAIAASRNWDEVLARLGLASGSGSARALVKSHATRLALAADHLDSRSASAGESPFARPANLAHLARAGPLMAASWFTLRGFDVAWPLEPARYDLLVTSAARTYRVQVKTTTSKADGGWAVRIASNRRHGTAVYSPEEVDHFFVVDGDLTCYLIPLRVVGGYQLIYLRRYAAFAVGRLRLDAA